jgi:hypothetical protein
MRVVFGTSACRYGHCLAWVTWMGGGAGPPPQNANATLVSHVIFFFLSFFFPHTFGSFGRARDRRGRRCRDPQCARDGAQHGTPDSRLELGAVVPRLQRLWYVRSGGGYNTM